MYHDPRQLCNREKYKSAEEMRQASRDEMEIRRPFVALKKKLHANDEDGGVGNGQPSMSMAAIFGGWQ